MEISLTLTALAAMALAIPLTAANVDWLYSAHEDQRWPASRERCGRALYAALVVTLVAIAGRSSDWRASRWWSRPA